MAYETLNNRCYSRAEKKPSNLGILPMILSFFNIMKRNAFIYDYVIHIRSMAWLCYQVLYEFLL